MPDLKALSPGVLGYVKDQLTILDEDKYYVPVMNILSSVCNHVVVRSRADARHVIQYYEKNKIG
jgi:chromosome segregation ATPase